MGYRTQFWEYEQTGDDKLIERLENENAQLKSDYLALTEKHQREINGWAESLQQREQVVETVKAELAQAQQREARLRVALKDLTMAISRSIHEGGVDLEAMAMDTKQALEEAGT